MAHEIPSALHRILMEEGQVCLPGLGTLSLAQQPALVSPIEGRAMPPAERVHFNANLVLDDGRLSRELTANRDYGSEAAAQLIVEYIQQTRESLDAGRTVVLEGIGKLFKHHDGELRFQPGGANFSKDSFGLPSIDLRPIVRQEKRRPGPADPLGTGGARQAATAASQRVRERVRSKLLHNDQLRQILWYVVAGMAILIALWGLLRLLGAVGSLATDDPREPVATTVPRDRLNVPPPQPQPRTPAPEIDANDVQPQPAPRLNEPPAGREEPADRGLGATVDPAADANRAVIAIGLYGRRRNVDKQVRRLTEAGYTPYTSREGQLTRVGVEFTYRTAQELEEVLRAVRAAYAEEAFVMIVNGEERRPE